MKKIIHVLVALASMLFSVNASAIDYHFCENGAGSNSPTVGSEAADGLTSSTPKRLTATLVSRWAALAPGDTINLCGDGAWDGVNITAAIGGSTYYTNRVIVRKYGAGNMPILNGNTGCTPDYSSTSCHVFSLASGSAFGGITVDGIWLKNNCDGCVGFSVRFMARYITIQNSRVSGFGSGIGCSENTGGMIPQHIAFLNNTVEDIEGNGITSFGCADVTIQYNRLYRVAKATQVWVSGAYQTMTWPFKIRDHGMYVSGTELNQPTYGVQNVDVSFNYIEDWGNGASDVGGTGKCATAAIVGHALQRGIKYSYNTLRNTQAADSHCWGIAISPANGGQDEKLYNVDLIGNRLFNVGQRAFELAACSNCRIEDNVVVLEYDTSDFLGITARQSTQSPIYPNDAITFRNNGVWIHGCTDTCWGYSFLPAVGTNHTFVSNTVTYGAGSTTGRGCFEVEAASSYGGGWNNNHCNNFNSWSNTHSTRAAFASARSQDQNSVECAPAFTGTPPTRFNNGNMIPTTGSCLIGAGHATLSSRTTHGGKIRPTPPSIGPFEKDRDTSPATWP